MGRTHGLATRLSALPNAASLGSRLMLSVRLLVRLAAIISAPPGPGARRSWSVGAAAMV